VALAEMGMPKNIGVQIAENSIAFLYGEDQARYVVAVPKAHADRILSDAKSAGVPAVLLGTTGGDKIAVGNASITLAELKRAHEGWFPAYMSAPHTN
jgi:phosphoribosylformylglycinamidine synthase